MRSRTGCMTCRSRKLKCDELKPVCRNCQKSSRDCQPSDGIVFRHQQNASMNDDGDEAGGGSLKSFYSYKNTFPRESIWVKVPKQVTFIDNSDPWAEDMDDIPPSSDEPINSAEWSPQAEYHNSASTAAHGLEALSTAATAGSYSFFQQPSPGGQETPANIRFTTAASPTMMSPNTPSRLSTFHSQSSPPTLVPTTTNNIHFLLNPPSGMTPPIDPSLQSPPAVPLSSSVSSSSVPNRPTIVQAIDTAVERDHELAFLLRHFSEVPGLWMDLFDMGTYFASYVPVKALTNPLLKYSACAYAAKQIYLMRGSKPVMGGATCTQASMEHWPDDGNTDWELYAANYYEKAIQNLQETLQKRGGILEVNGQDASVQWDDALSTEGGASNKRRRTGGWDGPNSDETLAATAILCVYEFMDASGTAWSRHLNGVKGMLDIGTADVMPEHRRLSIGGPLQKPKPTKARRAIFWNFARQDFLSAFINHSQTRLDTSDLRMWEDAGLLLDEKGHVKTSNIVSSAVYEGPELMREDMISNALVWILSKVVNFISAGDAIDSNRYATEKTIFGVGQDTLLERWHELDEDLDVWHQGLPDTFRPSARIRPNRSIDEPFEEIWFGRGMCASAMQSYHMARILLLSNKPQESTASRTTVTWRLNGYRAIETQVRMHSYEIVGISLSRPEGSVRIHALQPLFVAGQCLVESRERDVVVRLLKTIQTDTGWVTEHRVEQLFEEWRSPS